MKKNFVIAWSLVVALGGFLFGFDTAVISGAEKAIQNYWNLNVFEHGLTVSIALIGTVLGALIGSIPSDNFGRKNTLYLIAICYLLSALGTALAQDWAVFLSFRFLGGIGVGISSVGSYSITDFRYSAYSLSILRFRLSKTMKYSDPLKVVGKRTPPVII